MRFINVILEHGYHVARSQMCLIDAARYILILEASKEDAQPQLLVVCRSVQNWSKFSGVPPDVLQSN